MLKWRLKPSPAAVSPESPARAGALARARSVLGMKLSWPRFGRTGSVAPADAAAATPSGKAGRNIHHVEGAPLRRIDPETLLRRLEWTVIRRLDGLLQGDYRTLLRGFGLDLADLREYQAHDDVRFIDWNVTARLQTPHVREFQEDREVTGWFVLDLSGSVDFGSQRVRKREVSAELVGVLSRLLIRHGNRIGAVVHHGTPGNEKNQVIPARGGRRQVLHLLDRMLHPSPLGAAHDRIDPMHGRKEKNDRKAKGGDAPVGGKGTDLGELLSEAQQVIKRRSVVFVISDFISTPGWGRALELLARRHEVVAVRLYDPMEMEIPDLGLILMQDAETGEQIFLDTRDRDFRKRFVKLATEREATLRVALVNAGVDCIELATDENIAEALLRFTELRKRRSQLAAGGGSLRPPLVQ
jgi:uncharacterized protein (DUF58 family)